MADMTAPKVRPTGTVKIGDRDVQVQEPTEAQVFVLAQLPRMLEDKSRLATGLELFGGAIEDLLVEKADQDWVYREMVAGRLTVEQFGDLAIEIIKYFGLEVPDGGPQAPRKRAVAKRAAPRRR